MLGISAIGGGGEGYYVEAVARGVDEYYRGVGEAPGWWAGAAATELGLVGEVDSDDLRAVWGGHQPCSGDRLGRFPNRKVGGFDLCWRAPKSASLLFAFGSPDVSRAVRDAHDAAVAAAFGYLESNAAWTRLGRGGAQVQPVDGFAAALFRHRTSRTGDPHLHTHVLVANLAHGGDGKWRTLDGRPLYAHAKTAGHLYQAHLRHELTRRLGVAWGPVEKGCADIDGVDRSVIWAFSERRRQIVEHLDTVGFRTARAAQIATLETRPDKPAGGDVSIRDTWDAKAADLGVDPATLAEVIGQRLSPTDPHELGRLLDHLAGPRGVTEQQSTFDRRHVLRAVADGLPNGAAAATIEAAADEFLSRPDVVALGTTSDHTATTLYTTAELLDLEARLLDDAVARRGKGAGVADQRATHVVLGLRVTISAEQAEMVGRLCRGGDGVSVVTAAAGTGKTFALEAAYAAWKASGYEVIGCAVAAKAARELETSAKIPSRTLARMTADLAVGRLRLGTDTVVVIDEAGMAGTRQLAPVLDAAAAARAKVVLVGDPRQLPEIQAGGLFAALGRTLEPVTLSVNRRQVQPWERRALLDLRSGDVTRGLDAYQARGRLVTGPDAVAVRQRMVDDWYQWRRRGENVAMVAIRRADVDDLNGRARRHLAADDSLTGPVLQLDERPYQAGDEIVCLRNDYGFGVRNGDRAVVEAVDPERRTMRVRLDDGVRVLSTEYLDAGHVTHAYATTIHKAQGMTVDRCLTLGTDDLYREAGYVALSRGRVANVLYAVGGHGIDDDLTHAPQRKADNPVDLVRDAFRREAGKQLAIEKVAPDHDWGIGATERRRLHVEMEGPGPLPSSDDDFSVGL